MHFTNACLKSYDSDKYYKEDESFRYNLVTVDSTTFENLNEEEMFLQNLGVKTD